MKTSNRLPTATLLATIAAGFVASSIQAQTWTNYTAIATYPKPSKLYAGAMCFDPIGGNNTMLLYGGLQTVPTAVQSDTLTFNGVTWATLTPATTPPPRWGHQMVYDSRRNKIVTFGGRSPTTTATAGDTWEWDGTDWAQVFPTVSPSNRAFYSMTYDERRGRVIIRGAQGGGATSTQTWEYDGTTWMQVITATVPLGTEQPLLVYDKGRGVTVLWGGFDGTPPGQYLLDTYEYDGVDWTLRPTAHVPPGQYRASQGYDSTRGRVVMYGGALFVSTGNYLSQTWEYDGNDWTNTTNAAYTTPIGSPLPYSTTSQAIFGYMPITNQFVHFGGSGPSGSVINETWVYDGPKTAIASTFGSGGCDTSAGAVTLSATSLPVIGTNYVLGVNNGTFNGLSVIVHGFSNMSSLLGPLPADLTPLGWGGCLLQVSADTALFQGMVGGVASTTMALPNAPYLLNMQIYSQSAVLDGAAPNFNGGLSNAVHATLGL